MNLSPYLIVATTLYGTALSLLDKSVSDFPSFFILGFLSLYVAIEES